MANTLTGRILEVRPTQAIVSQRTGQTFNRRELILDCTRYDPYTGERGWENTPVVEFGGERCALLDGLAVGQVVTVSIDITGRRSPNSDRYFNSVQGYKVEVRNATAGAVEMPQQPTQQAIGYGVNGQPVYAATAQPVQRTIDQKAFVPSGGFGAHDVPF